MPRMIGLPAKISGFTEKTVHNDCTNDGDLVLQKELWCSSNSASEPGRNNALRSEVLQYYIRLQFAGDVPPVSKHRVIIAAVRSDANGTQDLLKKQTPVR